MISPYKPQLNTYDEVFDADGKVRDHYRFLTDFFSQYDDQRFKSLSEEAKLVFFNEGITFSVYSDNQATERIFPFDLVPRLITKTKWKKLSDGLLQRNLAINMFLDDIYNDAKILNDGTVPRGLINTSAYYLEQMKGFKPPGGVYNHISGSDLIRHADGEYYVLEDNVRSPSGVSYVIANRRTLKTTFPRLFADYKTHQVDDYSTYLLSMLQSVAPEGVNDPFCVVLTPGVYNSAYYEHTWLAQSMGINLVEGRDLQVINGYVYAKTIFGNKKVDVIYRRIDDDFIDPKTFRKDSMLGVYGLIDVYKAGNVSIVNAPGTGVADDKAVYIYMPKIIKYYLDQEPIISNVPTYRCELDSDYSYVIENLDKLVVKPVDESGGYGISVGSTLTKEQIANLKNVIKADRRKYIAQPIMSLSTHPTYMEDEGTFEPRHMDLRTFCLLGQNMHYVLPGGLTRVALKKGNLIVNSSQGGGSKDTWVIE